MMTPTFGLPPPVVCSPKPGLPVGLGAGLKGGTTEGVGAVPGPGPSVVVAPLTVPLRARQWHPQRESAALT
jgi:hypothetical protein